MIGCVRSARYLGSASGIGATFCTCPVFKEYFVTSRLPAPKIMSGFNGSGAAYPYSITPTGCQSRNVISPSFPRLETQTDPLSCCPPQTRYGNELLVAT